MPLRIEVLSRSHRTIAAGFQNQHESLAQYIKRFALRHTEKDLLARTYVAVDDVGSAPPRLAGYFSLSTVSVERASVAK